MAINLDVLGPQNDGEKEDFAIEALVFSVQLELQKALRDGRLTFAQLAEKLDMTPARVSQIFSSTAPNLTLKTIARIAFAADVELRIEVKSKNVVEEAPMKRMMKAVAHKTQKNGWHEVMPQNNNYRPYLAAA